MRKNHTYLNGCQSIFQFLFKNKKCWLIWLGLICFSGISAQSVLEQPITLKAENTPLISILDEIATQQKIRFAYDKKRIPTNKKFSITAESLPLQDALNQLFLGTTIQFSANKKQISLFRKIIPYHTISGYIQANESEEALVEANVFDVQSLRGVSSNNYGFYSLSLPEGRYVLQSTYIGYQDDLDTIDLYQDVQQNILLKIGANLSEIIVRSSSKDSLTSTSIFNGSEDNGERMNTEKAQFLPTIAGQGDLMKAVQLLPGVVSGGLDGNKLFVRGGSLDQNLVLLDDVPLYNLNHLFGLVSILNGDIIQSSKTYFDGFPARYGGRLSSLMDIRTKEGNKQQFHGGASLGWLIATAYLEGPLQKGKSSFILSTRRTWVNDILNFSPVFDFNDVNAKMNFKLSSKDRLFLSFYTGKDSTIEHFDQDSLETIHDEYFDLNWRNTAFSLRWNRILGKQLFVNTTLLQGTFNYNILYGEEIDAEKMDAAYFHYNSFIKQYGLKTDFTYLPSTKHHIRFGGSYRFLQNNPGNLKRDLTIRGEKSFFLDTPGVIAARESYLYGEDEIKLTDQWTLNAGIHLANMRVQGKNWWLPQLRFFLKYAKNENQSWTLTYSDMAQSIHLLNDSGIELGDSKWVATTKQIRPSTAQQISLTFQSFFNANWRFKSSVYYKRMNHLRRFKVGANVTNSILDWEGNTLVGKGKSAGLELSLAKIKGATTGWLTYTLAKNQRQFNGLNDSQFFPHQQDRRHIFNASLTHEFKEKKHKKRQINAIWTCASGQWVTLPERVFTSQLGVIVPDYQRVNNFQLTANHRLDISYNQLKTTPTGFQHRWTFGIYNVYGKINPYSTIFEWQPTERNFSLQGEYFTHLPTPFVTYGFKF